MDIITAPDTTVQVMTSWTSVAGHGKAIAHA